MTENRTVISWDTWLFASLAVLYIALYEDPKGVFLVFILTLYIAIDLFWPWEHLHPRRALSLRRVYLVKLTLILLAVALVAVMPAGLWIAQRRASAPHMYAQDGLLQTEAALDFLREGRDPYAEDFRDTVMGQFEFNEAGLTVNPAFTYVAYMPFLFEFSYPFYRLGLAIWGWWDQRMLYISILLVLLGLSTSLSRQPWAKLCLVLIMGLNPLLMLGFIEGRNDVFELLWIALAWWALQRNRPTLGFVFVMLAAATKQTAWFLIPFYALHVAGPGFWKRAVWGRVARRLLPGVLAFLIAVLPFLLWHPADFLSDTVGIVTGSPQSPSAAKGYCLGGLFLAVGILPDVTAPYPFALFQLAVGIPTLVGLVLWLYRRADARLIWACGGLILLATGLMGRFFLANYIGFALALLAMAAFGDRNMAGDVPSTPVTRDVPEHQSA